MNVIQPATNLATPEKQPKKETNIGKLLLDLGKLSADEAERVLRLQKQENIKFGEAAVKLGFITEADIRQALAVQFDYPYLQTNEGGFSPDLVAAYQPFSTQVESLRALRTQLILRWFSEGNKALAVVSPKTGNGCSYIAANLAIVFSQLGENTLLIDANLRQPVQHVNFNLSETRGLSDVLIGRSGLEVITHLGAFENLSVLGAGTVPPNPQELLARSSFTDLLNQVMSDYDVIIVDTSASDISSDAQAVAGKCRGTLVVTRMNETKFSDLTALKDQLNGVGVRIIGAVANQF
ncbi:chain length determinant protein tyrosine kinase EpsG [Methylovorus glucosotrophus]|jgi:protein-tyrosine kinase|uniref:Chain length determinant protein tyrosine kinase EpsG n=1 Tax=Methylovorus glucosotrophus (strain SIP3-4) TaxID=582744 RepID=C6X6T4_METGS|nr:chain length determinant protein tyrosine kinase EpsG [Methylovorus glucosotrophus]ACT51077.1 chain length determinant protein tyrosine kinase EpsG [Methylovorus glucosotrophus SIP3-4]